MGKNEKILWCLLTITGLFIAGLIMFSYGQWNCRYGVSDAGVIVWMTGIIPAYILQRIEEKGGEE